MLYSSCLLKKKVSLGPLVKILLKTTTAHAAVKLSLRKVAKLSLRKIRFKLNKTELLTLYC